MDIATSSIESVLTELVWVHRDKLVDLANRSFQDVHPIKAISLNERENWVDGFVVVLLEALQEQKTSYPRFFQERMVTDLVASGIHPQLLLQISIAWSILVSNKFVLLTPPNMQTEATRWFSSFFAVYLGELASIIQETPAKSEAAAG